MPTVKSRKMSLLFHVVTRVKITIFKKKKKILLLEKLLKVNSYDNLT